MARRAAVNVARRATYIQVLWTWLCLRSAPAGNGVKLSQILPGPEQRTSGPRREAFTSWKVRGLSALRRSPGAAFSGRVTSGPGRRPGAPRPGGDCWNPWGLLRETEYGPSLSVAPLISSESARIHLAMLSMSENPRSPPSAFGLSVAKAPIFRLWIMAAARIIGGTIRPDRRANSF